MICPICNSAECRRSRRRTLLDYLASVVGNIPWRCARCSTRFRSRATPLAHTLSAHCSICGNIELKRISSELPEGFAGDALEFNIATDRTMGGERVGQRRGAGAKTGGTASATPGDIADDAGEIVK